jgi:cyclopropane fatty-acyl-phospholipid synthase-like methyltransferase
MLEDSLRHGRTDDKKIYGIEWGDPNELWFLKLVRDQYIQPYLNLDHRAIEIGPGGGRWTRYLLSFRELIVLDKHEGLLAELRKKFQAPQLVPILNCGPEVPNVAPDSVDFVFSFGVFVHLDAWIIESYLKALFSVVKPTANLVIQYSDKRKRQAKADPDFSENDPDRMRAMVDAAGYTIIEENVTALLHSSIMRFRKKRDGERMY